MMVQSKPYQWPGGMFHEFPPLSGEETDQLCLILGVSPTHRTKVTKSINIAFLQLLVRVSRQFKGISHARGIKQAKKLSFMDSPTPNTDEYFATVALAQSMGYSLNEFGSRVRNARHILVNSSSDFRENRALSNFCSHVICCADDVRPDWSLPSTENISDETLPLPTSGVLPFTQRALAMGCKRLREAIPNADTIISDLEKTSPRSLRDTIAKWRSVTLADAVAKHGRTVSYRKNSG